MNRYAHGAFPLILQPGLLGGFGRYILCFPYESLRPKPGHYSECPGSEGQHSSHGDPADGTCTQGQEGGGVSQTTPLWYIARATPVSVVVLTPLVGDETHQASIGTERPVWDQCMMQSQGLVSIPIDLLIDFLDEKIHLTVLAEQCNNPAPGNY